MVDDLDNAAQTQVDPGQWADPDDAVQQRIIRDREEYRAERKLSTIEAGRRKGGLLGAAMASAMVTMSELYEGKEIRDDIEEVSESAGRVGDIDADGIAVSVDGTSVWAPPPTNVTDGGS